MRGRDGQRYQRLDALALQEARAELRTTVSGPALEVTARLPRTAGLSRELLKRPLFQHCFGRELYRKVVARVGVRELAATREKGPGKILGRGLAAVIAQLAREGVENIGAGPSGVVSRVVSESLVSALPAPLRAVQTVGRFIGCLSQQGVYEGRPWMFSSATLRRLAQRLGAVQDLGARIGRIEVTPPGRR